MSLTNPTSNSKPPITRISTSLVNSNPQMYAASLAANPTPEEKIYAKNIMGLTNLEEKFNKNPNLTAARKEFWNLDPNIRQGLMWLNEGADYQQKSPSILSEVYHNVLGTIASPFKGIIAIGGEYSKLINTQYKMTRQFLDTGKTDKEAYQYVISAKNWIDVYQGKNSWDEETNKTLNEKHGTAMSTLVKGVIDGKKPGDIIREYGDLAADGGAMTKAIMAMSNGDKTYKNAYSEYKAYQINPGNDLTNWANSNHPPSDGGVWGAIIPAALAVTHPFSVSSALNSGSLLETLPTAINLITKNKETIKSINEKTNIVSRDKIADEWKVRNPNPYGKETFVSPSGEINAWYQVAIDPLTYLTGGSTKGMLVSEALAEQFIKTSKAKGSIQAVADLAENPQWAKRQEKLAFAVSALRDARAAGNDVEAGYIRNDIANYFIIRITN